VIAGLQERLTRAESLLLVLQERLPGDLLDQLLLARRRGVEVYVLFRRFRDGAYLSRLHDAGMKLFEAAIPDAEPSAVFVDRHEGYALPVWTPIENAFSRAYQLLWRRLGVVLDVEGRVKRVAPEDPLVELEAVRPVFLNVRGLPSATLISEGQTIRALGVAAFVGIRGMALLLDTLHVERSDP